MPTIADIWGDQHVASGSTTNASKPKIAAKNVIVPDDWELDEEQEEEDKEEAEGEQDTSRSADLGNKQLWEDANAEVHHPMPSLVISRGTSSTSAALASLPLNQPPPMRILKRPSPSSLSPTTSTTSGSATGETLKEREARYHAARERIFGPSPSEESEDIRTVQVKLVREPRGPDANGGSNFDTKGFGERKARQLSATS